MALAGALSAGAVAGQEADPPFGPDGYRVERVELRQVVANGATLVVRNPYGDVRIRKGGEPGSEAVAFAVLQQFEGEPLLALEAESANGLVLFSVAEKPSSPEKENQADLLHRLDLVVFAPLETELEVHTTDGLIDVRKTSGDVLLASESGAISTVSVQGNVNVRGGSGTVRVLVSHSALDDRPQRIETSTGDVWLNVNDDSSLRVEVETGGEFHSDYVPKALTSDAAAEGQPPVNVIEAGKSVGTVTIASESGDVRIARRPLPREARKPRSTGSRSKRP